MSERDPFLADVDRDPPGDDEEFPKVTPVFVRDAEINPDRVVDVKVKGGRIRKMTRRVADHWDERGWKRL